MQEWKYINELYLNYLRDNYEPRIPRTDYGNGKLKPFFGVLMTIGDLAYVTQISSAKPKHINMKQQLDFYKIKRNENVVAVVNLNYMFPVPFSEMTTLNNRNITQYVQFDSEKKKNNYIALLNYELSQIQLLPLEESAKQIYELKYIKPQHSVSKRSFDFKELEIAAHNWNLQ